MFRSSVRIDEKYKPLHRTKIGSMEAMTERKLAVFCGRSGNETCIGGPEEPSRISKDLRRRSLIHSMQPFGRG